MTDLQSTTDATPRIAKGFAVTALVTGIVGTVFGLIPILFLLSLTLGIIALVFGLISWRQRRKGGQKGGMAIAGTILGIVAVALGIVGIAIVNDAFEDLEDDLEQIERDLND